MAKSETPNASKIVAEQGTIATGGPVIQGDTGATVGEATVTVEDKNGKRDSKTASADGSFRFTDADLQEGFSCRRGNEIKVTQTVPRPDESDAASVTVR